MPICFTYRKNGLYIRDSKGERGAYMMVWGMYHAGNCGSAQVFAGGEEVLSLFGLISLL